jgi:2-hydroxychromene-2-carboxylate isomerase
MERPAVDFWFDFASPYSYVAAMRVRPLANRGEVRLRFRPFLLGAIFKAQGWSTSPFNIYPAKGRHMWRDLQRICAELALPLRPPDPFPQSSLLAARVALIALQDHWGEDFCRAIFRAEFADAQQIDDHQTISRVLADLAIDAAPLLQAAQSLAIKDKLRAETAEAQRLGIFGAPTFITANGELFWGNDRLESALSWARSEN